MGSPCWGMPQQGLIARTSSEFSDMRLQYRSTGPSRRRWSLVCSKPDWLRFRARQRPWHRLL